MKPLTEIDSRGVRALLFDIDDTLTTTGKLTAAAYAALERWHGAGKLAVAVTGRPAGWCDLMARMWPAGAVIGENGGICFRHDRASGLVERHYWTAPAERAEAAARLAALGASQLPGERSR